jgi:hypothetical protein
MDPGSSPGVTGRVELGVTGRVELGVTGRVEFGVTGRVEPGVTGWGPGVTFICHTGLDPVSISSVIPDLIRYLCLKLTRGQIPIVFDVQGAFGPLGCFRGASKHRKTILTSRKGNNNNKFDLQHERC